MKNIVRTVGVAILNGLMAKIAMVSGIISAIALLVLIFAANFRTVGFFVFFLITSTICFFAARALRKTVNRSGALLDDVNAKENLALEAADLLGFPCPAFFAFDKPNRKMAICNSITGDYKLIDFGNVVRWRYEGETPSQSRKNFAVVLEVTNSKHPLVKFPMLNEAMAQTWCTQLNAVFDGSIRAR